MLTRGLRVAYACQGQLQLTDAPVPQGFTELREQSVEFFFTVRDGSRGGEDTARGRRQVVGLVKHAPPSTPMTVSMLMVVSRRIDLAEPSTGGASGAFGCLILQLDPSEQLAEHELCALTIMGKPVKNTNTRAACEIIELNGRLSARRGTQCWT